MNAHQPMQDALANRLLAALADVPANERPHFGRISHELKISATEVTVGVWQLVNSGRIDRETLRPPSRQRPRPYCQQPEACQAKRSARAAWAAGPRISRRNRRQTRSSRSLTEAAAKRLAVRSGCGAASATAKCRRPRRSPVNHRGARPSCRHTLKECRL
jgi:hypothetical protein